MVEDSGKRLRQAREARGWSTGDLAKAAETHYQTVWNHEQGDSIGARTLKKYAEALHTTEAWIRYGIGSAPGDGWLEIVEEYLRTDSGRTTKPAVRRLLRQLPYTSLGVRIPRIGMVQQVRWLIESNLKSDKSEE